MLLDSFGPMYRSCGVCNINVQRTGEELEPANAAGSVRFEDQSLAVGFPASSHPRQPPSIELTLL